MTQTLNFRNLIAASAVAGAAAIAMFAQSAPASATTEDVMACRGASRSALVKCCRNEVRENGLPNWMRASGQNCQSAGVVCKSKAGGGWKLAVAIAPSDVKKCRYVTYLQPNDREGGGDHPAGGKPSRGTNGGNSKPF